MIVSICGFSIASLAPAAAPGGGRNPPLEAARRVPSERNGDVTIVRRTKKPRVEIVIL